MPQIEHFKNENKVKKDIRKEVEKNLNTDKDPPNLASFGRFSLAVMG